ncbi:hypothetical protein [Amycolatopsis sp.]|uniref:hypothetical protein n=1 Tax=Amycolatopsis sp. TaxID=37632 RepID=UPI002DFE1D73|nr:hypothetical protein [Amycolatopsis sp.]
MAQPPAVMSSPVVASPVTTAPGLGTNPDKSASKSTPPAPPLSPEKITAACPLLRVVDMEKLNGGTWAAKAEEGEPVKDGFRCGYSTQYNRYSGYTPNQLLVIAVPGNASPAKELAVRTKDCTQPAVAVAGAGESASYCEIDEHRTLVMIGKRGHGETRVASVDVDRTRAEVYVEVAKLLAERL